MVRAVSPWYLVAWNTSFTARSTFQAFDLCFLSLSQLSCRFSSCCMLRPSKSSRVCLRRCHCAPSGLKGPEANWIVAISRVVTALVRPLVVSQNAGFSNIRTTAVPGGFRMMSKMSSFPRFLSTNVSGSLDMWGTENLSLYGCFSIYTPHVCRSDSIFSLISEVGPCCSCPSSPRCPLFPSLVFRDGSSHVFFHLWMDWPLVFILDHRESQNWECEPEQWKFLGRYYLSFCACKRKCRVHPHSGGVSVRSHQHIR